MYIAVFIREFKDFPVLRGVLRVDGLQQGTQAEQKPN